MASTGWIFKGTGESVEKKEEIEGGLPVSYSRNVQFFNREKIWTNGSSPATLVAGSTASSVSASDGVSTISSAASYECTKDDLNLLGEAVGNKIQSQTWVEYGSWTED